MSALNSPFRLLLRWKREDPSVCTTKGYGCDGTCASRNAGPPFPRITIRPNILFDVLPFFVCPSFSPPCSDPTPLDYQGCTPYPSHQCLLANLDFSMPPGVLIEVLLPKWRSS